MGRDGFNNKLAHAGLGLGVRWVWSEAADGVKDAWSKIKQLSEAAYGVKQHME